MSDQERREVDSAAVIEQPQLPDRRLDEALGIDIYNPISAPPELKNEVLKRYEQDPANQDGR